MNDCFLGLFENFWSEHTIGLHVKPTFLSNSLACSLSILLKDDSEMDVGTDLEKGHILSQMENSREMDKHQDESFFNTNFRAAYPEELLALQVHSVVNVLFCG